MRLRRWIAAHFDCLMTVALAEIAAFDYCWPGFGSIDYSKTLLIHLVNFDTTEGGALSNSLFFFDLPNTRDAAETSTTTTNSTI